MSVDAVLFDLDGKLVDAASGLVAVLNALFVGAGRVPMPYAIVRNEVSNGARRLLKLLERCARYLRVRSRLFIEIAVIRKARSRNSVGHCHEQASST